ncbi:MAG: FHA domain-containing protein, partial [Myxococcota bacterium]|nr:FHA domain-containing protein [Myxococcota bacterium]
MSGTFEDSTAPRVGDDVTHAPCLVVLLECDRPLAGGARYSLENIDRVTLGRSDARSDTRQCEREVKTLNVRLPGRSLSVDHARLVRVGTSWAIEDMRSTNGTFVNGERVARAVLRDHDLCEIGHTLLRVNQRVPAPSNAPLDVDVQNEDARAPLTLDPVLAADLDALATVALHDVPILVLG